tara:strand:+ start:17648 stop:19714 length:2067 start_codon:yes stop_codon:yes gene_type:complete
MDLNELNKSQRKAVTYQDGSVFVIAGAGTGKTKTLTMRIAYLISIGYEPEKILAVTFTNKAAREMKERVINLVGKKAEKVTIKTFHSFALSFLKKHINLLSNNLNRNFGIIDEEDGKKIIKDFIKENNQKLAIGDTLYEKNPRYYKEITSKFKTRQIKFIDIDDEDLIVFEYYQEYLKKNNLLDFDDLIIYTEKILKENSEIRERYHDLFDNILVDEFQDSDLIQYNIIFLLSNKHTNVFVVGDPDQTIYSFRGSNYDNNINFLRDFNAEKIVLDQNYRSVNNILKSANRLISHNSNRPAIKDLKSNLGEGEKISYKVFYNSDDEAKWIANEINILKKSNIKPKNIAILYRNNYISRIFEDNLINNGISYTVYGGVSFYQRKEIKDILSYLRVILDKTKNYYLKRIINVPRRGIGLLTIEKLEKISEKNNISLFDSINYFEQKGEINNRILKFKKLIEDLRKNINNHETIVDFLKNLIEKTKYIEALKNDKDPHSEDRIQNINELKPIFMRADKLYDGSIENKIQKLLDQISLSTTLDNEKNQEKSIILSTIHQVKGLEFEAVFMVAMERGIFPRDEESLELDEERRVCYVGITRAKKQLYLTYSQQRFVFGQLKYQTASKFINETKVIEQKNEENISTGDKVIHGEFGEGIVISHSDGILTIAFKFPHKIKKFESNSAFIKKKKLVN